VIVTTPGTKVGEPIGPPQGNPMPPGGKKDDKGGKKDDKNGKTGFEGNVEPPVGGSGSVAIPEAPGGAGLDIVPPAVVPNIPATPTKSPF
jgi:hypothetical protein